MPRRKGGKAKGASSKPRRPSKTDASINKWKTADDIPMDEVDQFHNSRDKILLDGDSNEYLDGDDDDEVFALKGVEDEDDDDDEEYDDGYVDEDEEMKEIIEKPKTKRKGKNKGKEALSDEEDEDEEPEEESWGRGKAAYYNSNADELESDDEEGHELEEQESKRLQAKSREHMTDEDFGLNDIIEIQKDDFDILDEPAPVVAAPLPTEPQDIIRHLEKTNPEALALARDWEDTAVQLLHVQQKIQEIEKEQPDVLSLGMIHFHYQTLLSYTAVLAFFIHLRAMSKYAQRPSLLQAHPIMKRLLTLKQALITMENLDFTMSDDEDYEDEDDEFFDTLDEADEEEARTLWDAIKIQGLDDDELDGLIKDAQAGKTEKLERLKTDPTDHKKSKDKKAREPQKKKRKVQKDESQPPKPIFDLEEPVFVSSSAKSLSSHNLEDDSYGESQYLHQADAADKAARKKSLQFHTAKIESASARRSSARNQAMGGDDDIPYRERAKEKALRLDQDAKRRLAAQGGADLDDVEPELPTGKRKLEDDSEESDGNESPDDYYELVKRKSKEKKEKKKVEYDEARDANKFQVEENDATGPRSLTRAILKNRGLTPHRSKAVRNPRVKKRQKYDQAKKKLSSQKAIYKGGVSATKGRYDGERSGISKTIKSTRLG